MPASFTTTTCARWILPLWTIYRYLKCVCYISTLGYINPKCRRHTEGLWTLSRLHSTLPPTLSGQTAGNSFILLGPHALGVIETVLWQWEDESRGMLMRRIQQTTKWVQFSVASILRASFIKLHLFNCRRQFAIMLRNQMINTNFAWFFVQ